MYSLYNVAGDKGAGYKRPIFTATTTKPIVERMKQYPFIDRGLLQSQTVTLI